MSQSLMNIEKEVVDKVLLKVNREVDLGIIKLPPDYSHENAIKQAMFVIAQTVDKDKRLALEVCTPLSIQKAVYEMVIQGLNPYKKQCNFIVRGGQLCCDRSYFGTIAVAKRFAGLKHIKANVIYEGDRPGFKYEIDPKTGRQRVLSHIPDLKNQDDNKIIGGYAIYELSDGTTDMELMTMPEIREAWKMGQQKGVGNVHNNFTGQMVKRTLYNRACKILINSSDDAAILPRGEDEDQLAVDRGIDDANTQTISFEEESMQTEMKPTAKSAPEPKERKAQPQQSIVEEAQVVTENGSSQDEAPY